MCVPSPDFCLCFEQGWWSNGVLPKSVGHPFSAKKHEKRARSKHGRRSEERASVRENDFIRHSISCILAHTLYTCTFMCNGRSVLPSPSHPLRPPPSIVCVRLWRRQPFQVSELGLSLHILSQIVPHATRRVGARRLGVSVSVMSPRVQSLIQPQAAPSPVPRPCVVGF